MEIQGLLLIDKQRDWTSFDVVAKIRGIIKRETGQKVKVGHSGTLDPQATGLLVLAIGKATKQIETLTKLPKTYEVEVTLGKTSTTDDSEGELQVIVSNPLVEQAEILSVLNQFEGMSEQVPPQFSAIKIDGQRAYKMARKGKKVELKPRQVEMYFSDVVYEAPVVTFTAEVSSGTYIRSLARDIGQQLGCGAYMSALRRTQVGKFRVQEASQVDELNLESIQKALKPLK